MSLTSGAVQQIYNGQTPHHPIVQVIDSKQIENKQNPGQERYRLQISDGVKFHKQAMLATQLNQKLKSGELATFSVIKLTEYICNVVNGRRIIIILGMEIVSSQAGIIGSPTNVDGADAQPAQAPQQPPQQQNQPPAPAPAQQQVPQQQYQPPASSARPSGGRMAGAVSTLDSTNTMDIANLNPYQNKWTIKARVTAINDVRTYNNAKGPGRVQSFEVADKKGGEIRMTMFNELIDKFGPILAVDGVYLISKGQFKPANKRYNSTNHDYECTLGRETTIEPVQDDNSIAKMNFNFTKIQNIAAQDVGSKVDICCVVINFSQVDEITIRRDNSTLLRRNLTVVDDSNVSVQFTLWGNAASAYNDDHWSRQPVISVKGAKVGEFNGKNLGTIGSTIIKLDDDTPEVHAMRAWFTSNKDTLAPAPLGGNSGGGSGAYDTRPRKLLSSIKTEALGGGEKPDYLTVRATVTFIRHDADRKPWYDSDPETKKKVVEQADGNFYCEATNKYMPSCVRRYILSMQVADSSGAQWVSCFDNEGQAILGKTADEMHEMQLAGDEEGYERVFQEAQYRRYLMAVRVKNETYQDQERVKATVHKLWPMDFKTESDLLLQEIAQYGEHP